MVKPLTTARADRVLAAASGQLQLDGSASRTNVAVTALWGAKAIGRFMGLSADTVRRIEKSDPTAPIYRPAGRLLAFKSELIDWMKKK
ncbi:hypothetical protein [Agrobacterium burrii]|uniref:Helix-turn-helix domain-containing protein n=1 Tax=Agrobacterium burrii TaxID=2815339 RepID=A0ABS3EDA2_9HYPH|nr:hypothetical protein [Agrobacterium burrii]MBO0129926.1 hypothetical protein [Agrobacterium burrii]